MTEELRLETIHPRLATPEAVDLYNRLAAEYNARCSGRISSDEERTEAVAYIAESREVIVAGAIEDVRRINSQSPLAPDRAQRLLSMLGYDPGVVDGVYGEQTRAAIEAFQRDRGGPVDGLLSQKLLDQMIVALAQDETGWSERVVVSVYVTRSDVPIAGAEVTLSNDDGMRRNASADESGRAEFAGMPPGEWTVHVQQSGFGSTFQAMITEDPRQDVWVVLPEPPQDEIR